VCTVVLTTGTVPWFWAGADLKQAAPEGIDYIERFQTQNCVTAASELRKI
jgi:hypothetical protein